MSNDPIVGIDLGTTNSVVAFTDDAGTTTVLADDKGFKIQPSVVSFHPNGSVLVGADAKQRRIIDPRNTVYSAKRLIGRTFRSREVAAAAARMPYAIKEGVNQQPVIATRAGEFAIPEISAIVLDHMRSLAKKALATDVSRAVITVPANFTDAQRSATATAGAIAGITVVRVLNEPTAAALAYGQLQRARGDLRDHIIAVYDFGGGTFDVTLLKLQDEVYEVLSTAGDSFLGGDDIDERLVDHMVEQFLRETRNDLRGDDLAMQRLRAVAEQTKIELSRRSRAIIKVDEIAYGAGGKPLDLTLEISRDEFVSRVTDIVERTFPVCAEALRAAGLQPGGVDEVVLVGGTTKMPLVRERVHNFFGKAPRTDLNPDEAVAIGAGIQADALARVLGGAGPRPTARRSVAPPAPPMELRPETPPGARPPPSPAEAVARKLAPPARRTTPRVATTSERTAQAPPADTVVGEVLGDDDLEEVTNVRAGTGRITAPSAVPPAPGRAPPPTPAGARRTDPLYSAQGKAPLARITRPGTGGGGGTPPTGVPIREAIRPGAVLERDEEMDVPTSVRGKPLARDLFEVPEPEPSFGGDAATDVATSPRVDPLAPAEEDLATLVNEAAAAVPDEPSATFELSPHTPEPVTMPVAPTPGAPRLDLAALTPAPAIAPEPPRAPVVLDVVPQALGIGTVAGFCDEIVRRNAHVPCEQTRKFSTSKDYQEEVRIRICQGDSRRIAENVLLGEVVLSGLEPRKRGQITIEVAFQINASGILEVSARNELTGAEQKASVNLLGAQTTEEVDAARQRFRGLHRA